MQNYSINVNVEKKYVTLSEFEFIYYLYKHKAIALIKKKLCKDIQKNSPDNICDYLFVSFRQLENSPMP